MSRRPNPLLSSLALTALVGCGQDTATATLRALDPVGEISLVCLGRDDSGAFTRGLPRSECPDYEFALNNIYNRRFHALVTQPLSGEVALVDLGGDSREAVIDYEPTQPGYSFMPIGAEPGSITSTPGAVASFVGVREVGREGVFALPTSCIAPRPDDAPVRDIRTWPACRLPAAPGPLVMLVDPALDDDGDATTPDRVRSSCGGAYADVADLIGAAPAANRAECPADLATETVAPGRRKLGVMLPSLSEMWVLDAQELLDREPGSFDACNVEQRFRLTATPTDAVQRVPADLVPSSPSCSPVGFNHGPPIDEYQPWPADVALDDEQRLYVADSAAPVIHVLDVSDPCALSALPSLEPRSFLDPTAVISTRRVAVSQLTPLGKRYVYAVDNSTTTTAGTLMMFDVSPGSTDRTPIVRERSPLNPIEPPDRISLGRDVADVEFVYQDFPEPTNGLAAEGVACDPDLRVDPSSQPAEYRPAPDLSSGASPRKLRGTFAFAALHTGQISVIDVEDLDAACRRWPLVNPDAQEDLHGCRNDDPTLPSTGYLINETQSSTSGELSCNVVTPHRARARGYFSNDLGQRSAALVSFPTLTLDTGRTVTTDQTDEGRDYPKLLAARHAAGVDETVAIGPLTYGTQVPNGLVTVDPARAERSSLLLSYQEPRAYIPGEDYLAIYEGTVRTVSEALFTVDAATGLARVNEGLNASFCTSGVQDMDLAMEAGRNLGVTSPDDLARFARRHADYIQIVGDLLEEDDAYWSAPNAGATCGVELFQSGGTPSSLSGRPLCEQFFLPAEVQSENRDYRIVQASEDALVVEPRVGIDPNNPNGGASPSVLLSDTRKHLLSEFAACCFPDPTAFQIRAGNQWVVRGAATGFSHAVTTDPASQRCIADCSPMASFQRGRVFEISCNEGCPAGEEGLRPIGLATDDDFVCRVDSVEDGIDPGEPGSECVFQSLTTRFAIYRGQVPSRRDMRFRWQFADGFSPLLIGLTSVDRGRFSTPRSIVPWPENGQLILSDGSARGLTFVSSRPAFTISSIF